MTRYIFVTGGVVSSLGKGIASASLAAILGNGDRAVKFTGGTIGKSDCKHVDLQSALAPS